MTSQYLHFSRFVFFHTTRKNRLKFKLYAEIYRLCHTSSSLIFDLYPIPKRSEASKVLQYNPNKNFKTIDMSDSDKDVEAEGKLTRFFFYVGLTSFCPQFLLI